MNPADLRHRITIQEKRSIKDEDAISTIKWVDVITIWASFEPMATGSRTYFQAAAVQAENTVKFKIRYRKGITNAMRVLFNGEPYSIKNPINYKGLNKELHLICEVITNG